MRLQGRDLRAGMAGEDVTALQAELTHLGFAIPEKEWTERTFGVGTAQAVAAFQKTHGLLDTATVDEATASVLERAVAEAPTGTMRTPPPPAGGEPAGRPPARPAGNGRDAAEGRAAVGSGRDRLRGRVFFDHGLPAAQLTLRLYELAFAGRSLLLAETVTGDDGAYAADLREATGSGLLEVRALGVDAAEVVLTRSPRPVSDAGPLDLVAPAGRIRPLAPEHERLLADVTPHLGGRPLAAARETVDRPDVTLLREATGWDARLIALAATADRLAPETGIEAQVLYGLLRAGLPGTARALALTGAAAVEEALTRAARAGIVALASGQVHAAVAAHARLTKHTRRVTVAAGTLNSHGDMLAATGLSAADQDRFDDLHAQHAEDAPALWEAVERAGLPAGRLRLTGKLGYLTLNNARLTESLQRSVATATDLPAAMVQQGYDLPGTWLRHLRALADGTPDGLAAMVPPAYPGATAEERASAYATDLARKIRLAYPTELVARMVSRDELPLGPSVAAPMYQTVKADVAALLNRAAPLGFRLGATPVSAFLNEHADTLFAGLSAERAGAATGMVRTLQRLYQISPGDDALRVLLTSGFTAARDVTAMPHKDFLQRYGHKFPNTKDVDRVYGKAQQVTSTTYAFFGASAAIEAAPDLYATAPGAGVTEAAKKELLKQYPTLEKLLGSLDFCECDHCRSVLSPAAYLVDLLRFLDPDPDHWSGPGPTPYKVLEQRRPDLPELPLTCENTNTILPYIDVVNEILEYHIAHNGLGPGAAYDTGGAQSADLLAEPQRVLPGVYNTTLAGARYPLTLPFDLWLETVRRFFNHFDAPLWSVLEALRPTDSLYPDGTPPAPYARVDVFLDRLGLIPADVAILTEANPTAGWPEMYGYANATQALSELASAKTLAFRLGVSYRELVELVRTWFVNPTLGTLVALRKLAATNNLDLDIADVLRYQGAPGYEPYSPAEKAQFEAMLTPDGLAWLQGAWAAGDFATMLVLADPDAGCSFEQTRLRYANGSPADEMVFVTLNHFVRLQRRLGWTIRETDRALRAFLPSNPDPRTPATIGPALRTALLGLAHLDALAADLGVSARRRGALLDLWADLADERYAELFLTPRVLADDPIFDHPLGQYLHHLKAGTYVPYHWDPLQPESAATGNVSLASHLGAVQGTLKLTMDEIETILADAGTSVAAAALTVPVLSILNRYGLLAKTLRTPVADLIALKTMSGLNPFTPPSTAPVATLIEDHPYWQTMRFVQAVQVVAASGLTVADLDYALRHRFDPTGPMRAAAAAPLGLVRTLAREIARIRAEHTVPADGLDLSDDVLRQKLALILTPDVVDRFMGMWTGTITYHAVKPNVPPGDALPPAAFADAPAISVSYDPVSQEQRLAYRGVLVDTMRAALVAAHPQPSVAELLASVTAQAKEFFARHLEISVVGTEPVGFLSPADFDALFAPVPPGLDEAAVQAAERLRRATLADAFLPYLQRRLVHALIGPSVAAELGGADPALVESLLTDANLLADRAFPGERLMAAFAGADAAGLTTTGGPNSASSDGYIEVAEAGEYRFYVVCEVPGSTVELRLGHLADPLVQATTTSTGEEPSGYTSLRAGVAYRLTLAASGLGGGAVTILVQGGNLPKGPVDRLRLYPAAAVERIRRAHTLIGKVVRLAAGTELTEPELRHILANPDDFDGIDLGWLPTGSTDDAPGQLTVLFGQLRRVLDYRALRRELEAEPADLLDVLTHARRLYPATAAPAAASAEVFTDVCDRLGRLTRREPPVVVAAAEALGLAGGAALVAGGLSVTVAGLTDERGLGRVWTVMRLAGKLGVGPDALARFADPHPDSEVARDLRDTVKARYEVEAWRRVAQPVFDGLRRRRRDALVTYLVHKLGLERPEQLFELLLIDPGMEPVVQTSRLRLAISSVQLFVQRCLLNLELDVAPSAINAARWQWMRRYRVWEANRKIFLYPENWLEPEFRDDKTHLYTELESTLLQGDISDDRAEEVLVRYLRQMEELARLDIRALCLQERDDPAANIAHVVARTNSQPYKYFYRTYSRRTWTPWVPVTADIDSDHLVAVVWRGRLHLFWVTVLEKANTDANSGVTPQQMGDKKTHELWAPRKLQVQLNWSEYFQGQWTPRASSGFTGPIEITVSHTFDPRQILIHATVDADGAVLVHLNHIDFPDELSHAFRVVSRHGAPTVVDPSAPYPEIPYWADLEWGHHHYNGRLGVEFIEKITNKDGVVTKDEESETILNQSHDFVFTTASTGSSKVPADLAPLVSPFFIADERRTFFVEPVVTETTVSSFDNWLTVKAPTEVMVAAGDKKIIAQVPATKAPPQPGPEPDPVWTGARFALAPAQDWLTAVGAIVSLGETTIGPLGASTGTRVGAAAVPASRGNI